MHSKTLSWFGALLLSLPLVTYAVPWKIYLLFGQSNMSGGATPGPDDVFNNPRVKVLAYNNCSGALHCANGFGIGDWFGKIAADSKACCGGNNAYVAQAANDILFSKPFPAPSFPAAPCSPYPSLNQAGKNDCVKNRFLLIGLK